jgi:acyl-CoA synthetase (AMP-forming)/AMP-acid ligase II
MKSVQPYQAKTSCDYNNQVCVGGFEPTIRDLYRTNSPHGLSLTTAYLYGGLVDEEGGVYNYMRNIGTEALTVVYLYYTAPGKKCVIHPEIEKFYTGMGGALGWFTRSMVESDSEKIKSVGTAFLFSDIKLVDDQGKEVPVGEMGEAWVRSPSNMKEYFDQPELTAQTLKDGWVATGDLLRKDEDGFYYFMDRKKDMIKTGGENVFAQEVEGVILSHEAVQHCVVIGLPDLQWGELVTAVIKLREGFTANQEEIQEHCKAHISSYKKPRRVIFVDEFPVSDTGKVQKFKLREKYGG